MNNISESNMVIANGLRELGQVPQKTKNTAMVMKEFVKLAKGIEQDLMDDGYDLTDSNTNYGSAQDYSKDVDIHNVELRGADRRLNLRLKKAAAMYKNNNLDGFMKEMALVGREVHSLGIVTKLLANTVESFISKIVNGHFGLNSNVQKAIPKLKKMSNRLQANRNDLKQLRDLADNLAEET